MHSALHTLQLPHRHTCVPTYPYPPHTTFPHIPPLLNKATSFRASWHRVLLAALPALLISSSLHLFLSPSAPLSTTHHLLLYPSCCLPHSSSPPFIIFPFAPRLIPSLSLLTVSSALLLLSLPLSPFHVSPYCCCSLPLLFS